MKKENLYCGMVEPWLAHFLLPEVGLALTPDDFDFYVMSEEKALLLGKHAPLVIEVERRKISTYFGYSVTLNLITSTRRVFLLFKENIGGEEGYRVEPFTGAPTNAVEIFKKTFRGLKAWPR